MVWVLNTIKVVFSTLLKDHYPIYLCLLCSTFNLFYLDYILSYKNIWSIMCPCYIVKKDFYTTEWLGVFISFSILLNCCVFVFSLSDFSLAFVSHCDHTLNKPQGSLRFKSRQLYRHVERDNTLKEFVFTFVWNKNQRKLYAGRPFF